MVVIVVTRKNTAAGVEAQIYKMNSDNMDKYIRLSRASADDICSHAYLSQEDWTQ